MQSKRGFTLVELLIVVGIIAILAAILFPVFGAARQKARQTTCLSNLKQIGMAILMYASDHDDCLPWPAFYSRAHVFWAETNHVEGNYIAFRKDTSASIDEILEPYVKSSEIWFCPSTGKDEIINSAAYGDMTFAQNQGSYVFNVQTPPNCPEMGGRPVRMIAGMPLDSFPRPSELALAWDLRHWYEPNDYGTPAPHNGGLNVLWVDMRAKWFNLRGRQGVIGKVNFLRSDSWKGAYDY